MVAMCSSKLQCVAEHEFAGLVLLQCVAASCSVAQLLLNLSIFSEYNICMQIILSAHKKNVFVFIF